MKAKFYLLFIIFFITEISANAQEPTHFTVVESTGESQLVFIKSILINNSPAQIGDEVGVYDQSLCVGAAVIASNSVNITVWKEISLFGGGTRPGAKIGNQLSFIIWQKNSGIEAAAIPSYESGYTGVVGEVMTIIAILNTQIAAEKVQLSIQVNPANSGTTDPLPGVHDYDKNSSVIVTASPANGFAFVNWTGEVENSTNSSSKIIMDKSKTLIANFKQNTSNMVDLTISSNPSGKIVLIDGVSYQAPKKFSWNVGTQHTISTQQVQSEGSNTQYIFTNWSDGGVRTHIITVSPATTTFTANFATNYYLSTSCNPANSGSVTPSSGWFSSGTSIQLSAQALYGSVYSFSSWTGDISATNNPVTLIMEAPKNIIANFAELPSRNVTFTSDPAIMNLTIDGVAYITPKTFAWRTGEIHEVKATEILQGSAGIRYIFSYWSDGEAATHKLTVPSSDVSYSAVYVEENLLSISASPSIGGTVDCNPAGPWYMKGTNVVVTAKNSSGYIFSNWSGDASGSSNPLQIRMTGSESISANFLLMGSEAVIRMPSDLRGVVGGKLELPILIQSDLNGLGIVSFQFTFNYNASVLKSTGIKTDGTLIASWPPVVTNTNTAGKIRVGAYNTSELANSGSLIILLFDIIGIQGSQSNLQFSEFIFNSGTPKVNLATSLFQVNVDKPDILGSVFYYGSNTPVPFVELGCTGNIPKEISTLNGSYSFQDFDLGNNYIITPSLTRFSYLKQNCIHASDAFLTAQAAFGLAQIAAAQQKAADVDKNGKLQMFDAALIMQYAVVGPPLIAESCVGEWIFQPANRNYINLSSTQVNQNYEAILIGDVNDDWPSPPGLAKAELNLCSLADPLLVVPGQEFSVQLPIKSREQILSVYFQLKYDPEMLNFRSATQSLELADFILFQKTEPGVVTCGLIAQNDKMVNNGLITLFFKAMDVNAISTINIIDCCINANPSMALKQQVKIGCDVTNPESFTIKQNYPNPFNPSTWISYSIPWQVPEHVTVRIYNIEGQLIKSLLDAEQGRGVYNLYWDGLNSEGNSTPSGLYICMITSNNKNDYIKIIKTK